MKRDCASTVSVAGNGGLKQRSLGWAATELGSSGTFGAAVTGIPLEGPERKPRVLLGLPEGAERAKLARELRISG